MNEKEFIKYLGENASWFETLTQTEKKLEVCKQCPYFKEARVKANQGHYNLVVLTAPPTHEDTNIGIHGQSRQWELLKQVVADTQEPHILLPTVLCPTTTPEPKIKAINCCKEFIQRLILKYTPKAIIAMGTTALKVLGIKKNATDTAGRVLYFNNIPVVVTHSFRSVFEDYASGYALLDTVKHHISRAVSVSKAPDPTIEINIQNVSLAALSKIPAGAVVAFDIETAAPRVPKEAGLQFRHKEHRCTVFSYAYDNTAYVINLPKKVKQDPIKDFLQREDITKVTFNGAFDIGSLEATLNVKTKGVVHDVLLMAYALMPERISAAMEGRGKATLKSLVVDYLPELAGYEEAGDIGKALKTDFNLLKPVWDDFLKYAAIDAWCTLQLYNKFKKHINPDKDCFITNKLLMALVEMERVGMPININYFESLLKDLQTEQAICLKEINEELRKLGDWYSFLHDKEVEKKNKRRKNKITSLPGPFPFEPSKAQHIRDLLFDTHWLNEKATAYTNKGQIATDEDALTPFAEKYPVIESILRYNKAQKAKELVEQALTTAEFNKYWAVHSQVKLVGTKTGRVSYTKPNLQQVPAYMDIGWKRDSNGGWVLKDDKHVPKWRANIKKGYIAPPGKVLLYADYKTLEIVVLAYYCAKYAKSEKQLLLESLKRGEDIHSYVAAKLNGLDYTYVYGNKEGCCKNIRSMAKRAIFGIIYGTTPRGFAFKNRVTEAEADKFLASIFMKFPEIKKYIRVIHTIAKEQGYVETLFGMKRYLPVLQWQPWNKRALRQAQNAPIQGTAGEMGKLATALLNEKLKRIGGCVHLNIHDAVISSVYPNTLDEGIKIYKECMIEYFTQFNWCVIPPKIDMEVGENWGSLCKVS